MIKYHGTPITPLNELSAMLTDSPRNLLIPFPEPRNYKLADKEADKIILDNGAFSFWRRGENKREWGDYYDWVEDKIGRVEFYIIPDKIDGTERENDKLIDHYHSLGWPKGVPVWHVNESIDRLVRLSSEFDYIAFGSAGEFATLGTREWYGRMDTAMRAIIDCNNSPVVKIHMLRCLNPDIFLNFPFYSGDSTNVAQNSHIAGWEPIVRRIEKYNSPPTYTKKFYPQPTLF